MFVGPLEHPFELADHLIEAGGFDHIFAAAGKAQELLGQFGGTVHAPFDAGHFLKMRITWFEVEHHQRNISLDPHEQVVEIMGNPAGEGPYGLHFFGLLEFFFQPLLFGDVGQDNNGGRGLTPHRITSDGYLAAVEVEEGIFVANRALLGIDQFFNTLFGLTLEKIGRIGIQQVFEADFEHLHGCFIGIHNPVGKHFQKSFGHAFKNGFQMLIARDQLFGQLPGIDGIQADDRPGFILFVRRI